MKKILNVVAWCAVLCALTLTSCNRKDPNSTFSSLPEEDVVNRLDLAASTAVNRLQYDPKQEYSINTLSSFTSILNEYDLNSLTAIAEEILERDYPEAAKQLANGEPISPTVVLSLSAPLYYGVYVAESETKKVNKVEECSDAIIIRCVDPEDGKNIETKIVVSGQTYTFVGIEATSEDIGATIEIPGDVVITISKEGQEVFRAHSKQSFIVNDSVDIEEEISFANLKGTAYAHFRSGSANAGFALSCSNAEVINLSMEAAPIKAPLKEENEALLDLLLRSLDSEVIVGETSCKVRLDIANLAQFEAIVSNVTEVQAYADSVERVEEEDDLEKHIYYARTLADKLNENVSLILYYNSDFEQAEISFIYDEEYGEVIPLIKFVEDNTIYNLISYFVEDIYDEESDEHETKVKEDKFKLTVEAIDKFMEDYSKWFNTESKPK